MYGEGVMTDWMCQKWYINFLAEDLDRKVDVDSDQIEILIENDQHYTTQEIANILNIWNSSVENHLHQFGYINHFDVWVPHKLNKKKKHLLDCISTCNSLLKHNKNVLFLKQIVMGKE